MVNELAPPKSPTVHTAGGAPGLGGWRPYAQLVRLPNVFTAIADIGVGSLCAAPALADQSQAWPVAVCLMVASACLYSAGMVWNDYFDMDQDRRERPFRPLPAGKVSMPAARTLGCCLLGVGWLAAAIAGLRGDRWNGLPAVVAGFLIATILLYDRWLKRTWAGPIGMASCRFLNVLLGFSAVGGGIRMGTLPAVIVGVYIAGVTWFARTEARASRRPMLVAAASLMLLALLSALPLPGAVSPGTSSPLFPYLLVALGFFIGGPICRAIAVPLPLFVQRAVKNSIFGLVVLDAALASALAGNSGLALLTLLLPAAYLGRWLYST